jgi:hypothetical protein
MYLRERGSVRVLAGFAKISGGIEVFVFNNSRTGHATLTFIGDHQPVNELYLKLSDSIIQGSLYFDLEEAVKEIGGLKRV